MQRKAWKLQEFIAHSPGTVTCLAMGRKSARVMATGGEDRRVKLWAVGRPTCIMSLAGHTSSVESAQFSHNEDCMAAGSLSGSIRVWDLEEAKLVRALCGHVSSVLSLDFHPHGNFVASGSMDATVKLWDVSRKGCINTFRGHTGCVNMVRFSPDGNWIVSAGDDGRVKVWDLAAGKLLAELSGHTAPVTGIAYHPTVLLLASASADRTVRVFDLETFAQVSVSGIELAASAVRRIAFHPEGLCLYVATTEQLKIYNHETMSCLETVQVGWRGGGGLVDMAVAPTFNQLVGVSYSGSTVTTYIADVKSCVPFSSPSLHSPSSPQGISIAKGVHNLVPRPVEEPPQANQQVVRCKGDASQSGSALPTTGRKSFSLKSESNKPRVVPDDSIVPDAPSDVEESCPVIDDVAAYNRVFKPKRTIKRSPSRPTTCPSQQQQQPTASTTINPPNKLFPATPSEDDDSGPFCPPPAQPPASLPNDVDKVTSNPRDSNVEISDFLPNKTPPTGTADGNDPFAGMWSMMGDGPKPTPPRTLDAKSGGCETANASSEAAVIQRLRTPHSAFLSVLSTRHKNLTTVRLMWPRENLRAALESAILLQDQAVLVDVLRVLVSNNKQWSLDLVALLLPQLSKLIWSKYPAYVETTCQAVRIILKNFATLIRQTINTAHAIGVDVTHEERQAKCRACLTSLESIRSAFDSKDVATKAGQYGREVYAMFSLLE
uniref:Katanin p80 WD40 repeat-containing subunit B1 n=1 Tax=Mesocestoides corti TaxID=53468 RepID=A0A5K3ESZ4_MESCO